MEVQCTLRAVDLKQVAGVLLLLRPLRLSQSRQPISLSALIGCTESSKELASMNN